MRSSSNAPASTGVARAVESWAAALSVQSLHDRVCLHASPLSWGDCGRGALSFVADGRRIVSSPAAAGRGRAFHVREARGEASGASMVCADRWCMRCLSRGNRP